MPCSQPYGVQSGSLTKEPPSLYYICGTLRAGWGSRHVQHPPSASVATAHGLPGTTASPLGRVPVGVSASQRVALSPHCCILWAQWQFPGRLSQSQGGLIRGHFHFILVKCTDTAISGCPVPHLPLHSSDPSLTGGLCGKGATGGVTTRVCLHSRPCSTVPHAEVCDRRLVGEGTIKLYCPPEFMDHIHQHLVTVRRGLCRQGKRPARAKPLPWPSPMVPCKVSLLPVQIARPGPE